MNHGYLASYQELAAALCHFDKRTIELLLTRAEKYRPPAHLSDLGIAGLMETSGRERRNRYFTIASYQTLVAQEKLDKDSAGYADVDLSKVGEFFPFGPEAFYTEHAALLKHQDRDARLTRNAPKKKARKNPLLADGTVKKGRPRKERPDGEESKPRKSRKRKLADEEEAGPSEPKKAPPAKKRRLNAKQGYTKHVFALFFSDIQFQSLPMTLLQFKQILLQTQIPQRLCLCRRNEDALQRMPQLSTPRMRRLRFPKNAVAQGKTPSLLHSHPRNVVAKLSKNS